MGKIFCLMGKSACGKDTIYKQILSAQNLPLKTLIPYTTRPIRDGERNGVEYYFLTDEEQQVLERQGKIIELRAYHTVHGLWKYFTVNDHQLDLANHDYLIIGTLESYARLQEYFGIDRLVPLYIDLEPGERLQRALDRERIQTEPKYAELCRRFLADEADFSSEKLAQAKISDIFINNDSVKCAKRIISFIKEHI
ncbi:MAG: guanylate kinase [Lachnospiraceae bacterium]|mgnify:FL=1|jgi:Guanylate kinase|nr:guanylate kinase [Lachnospiraceae bacterium]